MSLCPLIFDTWYPLTEIKHPPDSLQSIPGLGCDGLGKIDSDYTGTLGMTTLHDRLHWATPIRDRVQGHNKIRDLGCDWHHISDYRGIGIGDNPPTGYGFFKLLNSKRMSSCLGTVSMSH
jgi:hypothetical protein